MDNEQLPEQEDTISLPDTPENDRQDSPENTPAADPVNPLEVVPEVNDISDIHLDLDDIPDYDFSDTTEEQSEKAVEDTPEPPVLSEEDTQEFNEMFHAETTEAKPELRPHPVKKGRPKRKKGEGLFGIPNILATVIWALITLSVGVTLGRMLWVCASDVLAFGRQDRQVTVTIYEHDTIEDITDKLYNANLIRYPGLFKFYAKFAVDEGEIKPGMWDLNTMYDYHALVKMMSPSSTREVIKVMIPEGYSCRQIFELMQDNKVCTVQDLASYAATGELDDYWFLEDVVRGDKYCLEGFLFPDTYEFYKNEKPQNVLNKMLKNFDNRFSEDLQAKIPALNEHLSEMMRKDGRSEEYIANHQFRIRDILIVASMVEKETASTQEAYNIASVIYNRLFAWGSTPSFLNIDATIVYALDGKTDLTVDDLQVDSPYNTYFNRGLTPGPIANPGLACIKASLEPASTPYYYYVLDPSVGAHHFSKTLEEHEAFRASIGG